MTPRNHSRTRRSLSPSLETLGDRVLLSGASAASTDAIVLFQRNVLRRPTNAEQVDRAEEYAGPVLRRPLGRTKPADSVGDSALEAPRSVSRTTRASAGPAGPLVHARQMPVPREMLPRARNLIFRPNPGTSRPTRQPAGELAGSLVPYVTLATSENAGVVTEAIVELTNHVRAENGLPALTADPSLMEAARRHSQEMAAANNMAHTLPGSALPSLTDRAAAVHYRYASLGENIAYNQADASSVVASWMNSPPHRQNMLSTTFTDIGVGLDWNSRGEPYYTMMLGDRA